MKSIYILPLIVTCCLVNRVSLKSIENISNCQTNYADIMFALDESGSIGAPNFEIMKDFTKDIIKHFPIGSDNVRVGVITFSYSIKYVLNLNSYFTKEEILKKIDEIHYGRGGTMTNLALKRLKDRSFTKKYGNRKNVQNIAILMTDGTSDRPRMTKAAAEDLRETGTMVFAIGIKNYTESEIKNIASKPSSEFTFSVEEFGALKHIVNRLVSQTCLYIPCSTNPCKNDATCTNKGTDFHCKCHPGYRGNDCSIVDPCSTNPCHNGAKCTNKGSTFQCECIPGYRGDDCSKVDPCSKNPCQNKGKCTKKGDKFECECLPGYRGEDCSIVDPCSSNPCQNEGKCENKGQEFECKCVPGYKGYDCSTVDPCSSNPCQNEGRCTNKGVNFECECVPGYRGADCAIVDPCSSNPCQNEGKCTNKGDNFECECVPGYRGEDCAIVDPCSSHPCQNGATCKNNGNDFECQCSPEYKGKNCSVERPPCICRSSGDSSYKTFDGQMIHFIGTCSYTLTATKPGYDSTPFAVEVQSIKKDSKGLFYRIVDVKLPANIIRILPFSGILVNSVKRSLPIIENKEFSANFSVGSITLTTDWGLIVRYDRAHQVSVLLPPSFTNKVTGICGDCNDKKDDYRTKFGEPLSHNPVDFERLGESYRIFDANNSTCYTKNVIHNCTESHECNIFKKPEFEECARKLGKDRIDEFQEACQVDTCAYKHNKVNRKMSLCRMVDIFAKECRNAGAEIEWTTSKCSQICPNNQEYNSKVLTCQPSCTNKSPECSTYTEGCVCKPGFILSGEECVPESKCGCLKENFYMTLNEEIYSPDCLTKTVCHNGGEMKSIPMPACSLNKRCALKDGEYGCICSKDFTLYKGKCEKLGLGKFIRVQSAWFNMDSYYSYSTTHPNVCLQTCLQHDRCKSANYDNEKEICELFRTTAAESPLNRTDCPAKDYYQLKESKNIIKGASIRGCHRLLSVTGVPNEECEKECKKQRCEAFEYSEETKSCNILFSADKDDFDLVGNEHWTYYA